MLNFPLAALSSVLMAVFFLGSLSGCDRKQPVRDWRPSDHAGRAEAVEAPGPTQENPAGDDAIITAALQAWQESCVPCHGATGAGDGPARQPTVRMPDFRDATWQRSRTDFDLAGSIFRGKGTMPAYRDKIDAHAIATLVSVVRGFSAEAPTNVE